MEGEKGRGRRKVGEENTLERGKKLGEKNKNKFCRLPSTYRCVGFENAAKGRSNVRGISTAIGSRFHTVDSPSSFSLSSPSNSTGRDCYVSYDCFRFSFCELDPRTSSPPYITRGGIVASPH